LIYFDHKLFNISKLTPLAKLLHEDEKFWLRDEFDRESWNFTGLSIDISKTTPKTKKISKKTKKLRLSRRQCDLQEDLEYRFDMERKDPSDLIF
jgi:hypothetical protein